MAQAKSEELNYQSLMKSIKAKKFSPIYYLQGEEPYFIDRIVEQIVSLALSPDEQEFNLIRLYGQNTDVASIVTAARRFPMMAERQVVVVREVQLIQRYKDTLAELVQYAKNPQLSTVLVICHSEKVGEKRMKLPSEFENSCQLFVSSRIKESQVPGFISNYLAGRKITIEDSASNLVAEHIGNDAGRLAAELDKLVVAMGNAGGRVTSSEVERHIGISREYNDFELRDALINRDVLKANKIVKYFDKNQKDNPVQRTLSSLFSYFSNLMVAFYSPGKSDREVAEWLGLRNQWQAKDYIRGMKSFSGVKTMSIISAIRRADAKSKGVGNGIADSAAILRELIYYILH